MTGKTGATILVVDDDPAILAYVQSSLDEEEWTLLVSDNGVDALEQAARHQVDLVLTDVMMPEMNGVDLARIMRQRHPEMKIVFMTGYMCPQLTSDPFHDKIPCLKKPFTPRELRSILRLFLQRNRLSDS